MNLPRGTTCVSAGVGEDITFDIGLISDFDCVVIALDPTPKAKTYIAGKADLPPRFVFDPVGLWSSDTRLKFYSPADPSHASYSISNLQNTKTWVECPVERLDTIVERHSIESISLLKIDIEGAEYEVIDALLASEIRPSVLCVEFDQPSSLTRMLRYVSKLGRFKYRPVKVENWNVTFVLQ